MKLPLLLLLAFLALGPVWATSAHANAPSKEEPKAAASEDEDDTGAQDKGKKKKGDQTVTGGAFEGDPVYVHLRPLVFPIISERGAEQIVTLLVDLQTKDVDTATKMSNSLPRLRDTIIRGLYGGLSDGSMRNASALDIDKIKTRIVKAVNKVYGEGSAIDALIQAVAQRKL